MATTWLSSLHLCPTGHCYGPCRAGTGVEERWGAGKVTHNWHPGITSSHVVPCCAPCLSLLCYLRSPSALGFQLISALLDPFPLPGVICSETQLGTPQLGCPWPNSSGILPPRAAPSLPAPACSTSFSPFDFLDRCVTPSLCPPNSGVTYQIFQVPSWSTTSFCLHVWGRQDTLATLFKEFLTTVLFPFYSLLPWRCWQNVLQSLSLSHTDGPGPCFMMWRFLAPIVLFQGFGVMAEVETASAPL